MTGFIGIDAAAIQRELPPLIDVAPLSKGGQKLVFSARHPTDGDVVLKVIHPQQEMETTTREIKAVASIHNARVPKIFETGTLRTPAGDCIWFREQRVHGSPVRDMVRAGPLGLPALLRLGLQTLESLVAAEKVRIVHRDVKPDNIIGDPDGNFWLIDFGLARHLELHSLTNTSDIWGKQTLGYAPPEQSRNIKHDIDARSDLFALGVTLYECTLGVHPFRDGASGLIEVLQRVDKMPLPRLSSKVVPSGFADIVSTMTQKRRDHRPSTAAEALSWFRSISDAASA